MCSHSYFLDSEPVFFAPRRRMLRDCGPEVTGCPRTVLPPHSAPWSSQQGAPDTDLWISRLLEDLLDWKASETMVQPAQK